MADNPAQADGLPCPIHARHGQLLSGGGASTKGAAPDRKRCQFCDTNLEHKIDDVTAYLLFLEGRRPVCGKCRRHERVLEEVRRQERRCRG